MSDLNKSLRGYKGTFENLRKMADGSIRAQFDFQTDDGMELYRHFPDLDGKPLIVYFSLAPVNELEEFITAMPETKLNDSKWTASQKLRFRMLDYWKETIADDPSSKLAFQEWYEEQIDKIGKRYDDAKKQGAATVVGD